MSQPLPPLILSFAPFDPSGAGHLPADAITLAGLGAHPVSVATSILVQDTRRLESLEILAAELIDDQARCLLEDLTVQAMRVGPLYSAETVQTIAQIAADYSDVPLILHLETLPDPHADPDTEDMLMATFELLLPLADLTLTSHRQLLHWQTEGLLAHHSDNPARRLQQHGADWVLILDTPLRPGQTAHVLHGPEQAMANWPVAAAEQPSLHLHGPLGCAIALGLARGLTPQVAIDQALTHPGVTSPRWIQPGMGTRILLRSSS